MTDFTYFVISGDPLSGGNLQVLSSGSATFNDAFGNGLFEPDPTNSEDQITINTPSTVQITTSAYPNYAPTGGGVEIYTATINGNSVTFAYISAAGDGEDDNVNRIAILEGAVDVGDTIVGPSLEVAPSENPLDFSTVVCFAAGTLIDTPDGPVPVETLKAGDLVITRDHGPLPLRWVGQRHLTAQQLASAPRLQPYCIPAGALGEGLPSQDLILSPQHRVLMSTPAMAVNLGIEEALIAAKHMRSAHRLQDQDVTYVHLMFDDHEIVRSNGVWSESLYVGPEAQRSAQANEFMTIFREGADDASPAMTLSLPALKAWEVELT